MDIPGRPKGVFVAHSGYQKGALEVAKAADITLYQIREMRPNEPEDPNKTTGYSPKDPIKITGYSTFVISQNPEKVAWEYRCASSSAAILYGKDAHFRLI
jgi:hypothetical protein